MVYYHLGLFVPRAMEVRSAQGYGNGYSFGADFYPIWLTAREGLLHHRDPYSPEMTRQIQIGLFGRTLDDGAAAGDYRALAYPAFVDLLFWPLALLPFSAVRIGMVVILPAATALSIVFWLRSLRVRVRRATLVSLMLLTFRVTLCSKVCSLNKWDCWLDSFWPLRSPRSSEAGWFSREACWP
jgi:hypothetical protein